MARTLLENANYINDAIKPAIKSAIIAQGVSVSDSDSFLDYATKIGQISGGTTQVLTDGVISDTTNYQVATFNDVSNFDTIVISYNYDGTDADIGLSCKVSDIGNGISMIITPNNINNTFTFYVTKTSITLTYYRGDWKNITASIVAF